MRLDMYMAADRSKAEEIVAKKFGTFAPFPDVVVCDELMEWFMLRDICNGLSKEAAKLRKKRGAESEAKSLEESISSYRGRQQTLKPPPSYRSWAHVAEFFVLCGLKLRKKDMEDAAKVGPWIM